MYLLKITAPIPLPSQMVVLFFSCIRGDRVMVMVFNATFNKISGISWRPILLMEETGLPRENHRPAASHWKTFWIQTDCNQTSKRVCEDIVTISIWMGLIIAYAYHRITHTVHCKLLVKQLYNKVVCREIMEHMENFAT